MQVRRWEGKARQLQTRRGRWEQVCKRVGKIKSLKKLDGDIHRLGTVRAGM